MDHLKLYRGLAFIAILISPFVLRPWIESHNHRQLLIEKHGRLVDVRTSMPLANALVNIPLVLAPAVRRLHDRARDDECVVVMVSAGWLTTAFAIRMIARPSGAAPSGGARSGHDVQ